MTLLYPAILEHPLEGLGSARNGAAAGEHHLVGVSIRDQWHRVVHALA